MMRLSSIALQAATTSALLLAAPAALAQSEPPAVDAETLSALVSAYDVAGAAVVELSGCKPGPVVTAGLADIETSQPVDAHTVFEAASLSKPVFAYLTMMLANEGVIDLDQHISESFDYPRIADRSAYEAITPRMILTHRTGLPNWVDEATPFNERTA